MCGVETLSKRAKVMLVDYPLAPYVATWYLDSLKVARVSQHTYYARVSRIVCMLDATTTWE